MCYLWEDFKILGNQHQQLQPSQKTLATHQDQPETHSLYIHTVSLRKLYKNDTQSTIFSSIRRSSSLLWRHTLVNVCVTLLATRVCISTRKYGLSAMVKTVKRLSVAHHIPCFIVLFRTCSYFSEISWYVYNSIACKKQPNKALDYYINRKFGEFLFC